MQFLQIYTFDLAGVGLIPSGYARLTTKGRQGDDTILGSFEGDQVFSDDSFESSISII